MKEIHRNALKGKVHSSACDRHAKIPDQKRKTGGAKRGKEKVQAKVRKK